MKTIGEYLEAGVIRKLTEEEKERSRFWIPTFESDNKDDHKVRLVTYMRGLNTCHQVQKAQNRHMAKCAAGRERQKATVGSHYQLQVVIPSRATPSRYSKMDEDLSPKQGRPDGGHSIWLGPCAMVRQQVKQAVHDMAKQSTLGSLLVD